MFGTKTLSEVKAQLGLLAVQANGKSPKPKPTVRQVDTELENSLNKKLAELEREVKKPRKPKKRQPAKR